MNSGFFTNRYNSRKLFISGKGQGYRNLVNRVLSQEVSQLLDFSDYGYASIGLSLLRKIIYNTVNGIAPIRISFSSVDKTVGNRGKPHQNEVLLVKALLSKSGQESS